MLYTITHAMSFFDSIKAFLSRTPSAIVLIEPLTDHEKTMFEDVNETHGNGDVNEMLRPETIIGLYNSLSIIVNNLTNTGDNAALPTNPGDIANLPAYWKLLNPWIRFCILSSKKFNTIKDAASNQHIIVIAAQLKKPMSDPQEIIEALRIIRDELKICIDGGMMGGNRIPKRIPNRVPKRVPKRIPKGRLA